MKSEWRTVSLGSVAEISNKKVSITQLSEAQYVSTDNMLNNMGGVETAAKLPNVKSVVSFNEGDVLFSNIRTYFKKVWPASFSGGCSADVLVWKPKDEKIIDKTFLFYVLSSDVFTQYSVKTSKGVKMPRGDKKALLEFEFDLPPLETQLQIVQSIDPINKKIETNTQMKQTLEKIAQRIFKSWFIDFDPVKANAEGIPFADLSPDIQSLFPSEFIESEMGLIPKGWEVSSLGKISEFQNGYAFKASTLSHDRSENSIAVLKMGNIKKGGGFKWDGSKDYYELPDGKLGKLAKHLAKRGDLLMSMTDMKANVALLGHTACMPVDDEFLVNQRVGHIKVIDSRIADFPFLYLQTNENSFIHELRTQANSGVQVNLSTAAIKAAKVVLPTTDVHQAFNQVVKPLFERIFANELQNRTLTKVRDKLLPKLLSGSIEINDDIEEKVAEAS